MRVDNPKVTISVLTYNRGKLVEQLIKELCELKYYPLEIIVIDNNSPDDTQDRLQKYNSNINYIRTNENIGVVARNIGLQKATGDIVITLDDDVSGINDMGINCLVGLFVSQKELGAVNFKVLEPDTNEIINWVHHCKVEDYHDKKFMTYEITEGAVAFKRSVVDVTGGYSTHFFISHEGPDLAFRIFEAGFDVIYSGDITVNHFTAEQGRELWRNYYYDTRNQFWLAARNFPMGYAIRYMSRGLLSMLIYSLRDGYGKYWVKAVFDGIKGLKKIKKERSVLSKKTMKIIKEIDALRPGLLYFIRKRLFQRAIKI